MSAGVLAEGEIVRDGRRLLRKLLLPHARLVASADGSYGLMISAREDGKRGLTVSAKLVGEFKRRDWIAPAPDDADSFILSDAGLGWIRRALSDGNPFAAQHRIEKRRDIADDKGSVATVTVNEGESHWAGCFAGGVPTDAH